MNLSENYLLVKCITNLKRIHEKLFKLSRLQGQIIDVKCSNRNKSAILNFFQPLLNLSKNYLLVTCITNLQRIREKLFLSRLQGQIIDVKCSNRNKSAILNFIPPLLILSKNYLLVTCITSLKRILFK